MIKIKKILDCLLYFITGPCFFAFANSAISDIIATTIESRTRAFADNLTNNNALLVALKNAGNAKMITGGSTVMEEIMYDDPSTNNAMSFSGFETINIGTDSPLSGATFNMKHYADAVTISGPEILANSSKEQMIDLLSSRIEVAMARLANKIDLDLHGNESGNAGKNLAGLADALPTGAVGGASSGPVRVASGTYGNISRATWAFWRHLYGTGTTNVGAAATSSTIQKAMNATALPLVRGKDRPTLIYAGSAAYALFLESLQTIQRITSETDGMAGFSALKYFGTGGASDVVLGGGIGGNATTGTMLFINPKFMKFRPHKARNFVPIGGDRQAVNQDAVVRLFGWSGALTCSGLEFQGRLDATT